MADNWDGKERRRETIQVAQIISKIDTKLSLMEEEIEAKISTLSIRIDDFKELFDRTIESMNTAWNNRSDMYLKENSEAHEILANTLKSFAEDVTEMRQDLTSLMSEIHRMEDNKIREKADLVDTGKSIFFKVFITGIAGTVVSFIGWAIVQFIKSK